MVGGALALVAALALAWFVFPGVFGGQGAGARAPATTRVQRGDITAIAGGSGPVTSRRTLDLAFGVGGGVRDVLVRDGASVTAGQLLARVDDRQLQLQLADARATLRQARDTLGDLEKPEVDEDRVRQQRNQVERARDTVLEAEATLGDLENPEADEDALRQQRSQVRRARDTLAEARDALEELEDADAGEDRLRPQRARVRQAEDGLTEAQDTLRELEDPEIDPDRLRRQRAQVRQARTAFDEATIALADLVKPEVNDDAMTQQRIAVERAERAVRQTELSLAETTLEAPFAGTITAVNVREGGRAGGVAFRLVDTRDRYVGLTLSENDAVDVQVGQAATLSLDSVQGWTADGEVEYVAPAATTTNGVVTYEVRVAMPPDDGTVKIGMTVNADIVTARKRGVLLLPNSALLPKGAGRSVEVPGPGGEGVREVVVRTGLTDGTRTELLDGLDAGDLVIADPTADDGASTGGFGG